MKNIRLFSVLFVAFLALLLLVNPTEARAATYGEFTYEISNGEVTITGHGFLSSDTIEIPATIEGYPVTGIGDGAFNGCSGLVSVIIPDSVTTIGMEAFYYCTGLNSITIPDSVTSIGVDAFYFCNNLTGIWVDSDNVNYSSDSYGCLFDKNKTTLLQVPARLSGSYTIPDGVTNIGRSAFYCCTDLTAVTIPDSVISIGHGAFDTCTGLTWITIPDSVTTIGDNAFSFCTGLVVVAIPESVKTIGYGTFYYCTSLNNIWVDSNNKNYSGDSYGCLFDKNKTTLIQAPMKLSGSYKIPDGVTTIGDSAFSGCVGLTAVTIPDSVVSIGYSAFQRCTGLSSVTIPTSVTSIKVCMFEGCTGLTSIIIPESVTRIESSAFSGCAGLASVTIPSSVTYIDPGAFGNCTNLTGIWVGSDNKNYSNDAYGCLFDKNKTELLQAPAKISGSYKIPESVVSVSYQAFWGCSDLTAVIIPDGVIDIQGGAFAQTGLTSVIIPNSVASIENMAFWNCPDLTTITIGSGVTHIGDGAFSACSSLTGIWVDTNNNNYSSDSYGCLFDKHKTTLLRAPMKLSGSYRIPDSVISIGQSSFSQCVELTSVMIGSNVTTIGAHAFSGCKGLTSVTIDVTDLKVDQQPFGGCESLQTIVFIGSAPTMDKTAFDDIDSTAYYPSGEASWRESILQSSADSITWVAYDELVRVGETTYTTIEDAQAACSEGQYLILQTNAVADVELIGDLYIDLNGYDLSGTVNTNGYMIYGMDSTMDSYSCESIGYFNCVDENGSAIVPATHFKSDITGETRRYMAIQSENGFSFHRFYLGITHQSLKPTTTGVGYKALFCGDEMVAANLDSFGFTMCLAGNDPITVKLGADKFVSGKAFTLRIDNYDVERYGQTELSACVMLKLADGTVIEGAAGTMTLRGLLEQLNSNYTALTADQLTAVADMIKKYATIQSWKVENLI